MCWILINLPARYSPSPSILFTSLLTSLGTPLSALHGKTALILIHTQGEQARVCVSVCVVCVCTVCVCVCVCVCACACVCVCTKHHHPFLPARVTYHTVIVQYLNTSHACGLLLQYNSLFRWFIAQPCFSRASQASRNTTAVLVNSD